MQGGDMKTIRISDEVWNEIAQRGKFGETEDDVLRRIFNLKKEVNMRNAFQRSSNKTKWPLHTDVTDDGRLVVDFDNGQRKEWKLPRRDGDKGSLKKILGEALTFAEENEATLGQKNAIRKALTDNGYHLTK